MTESNIAPMPQVMRLQPAVSGTIVRDPVTRQVLPDEGAEVEMTTYWLRRLAQGDVVEVAAPAAQAKVDKAAKATQAK